MHTRELFHKPGLEDAAVVMEQLRSNPRELHLVGARLSVVWRILLFIISIGVVFFLENIFAFEYIETASLVSLICGIALLPLPFTLIPWWLISTYRHQMRSFEYCKKIYTGGVACIGSINTLTRLTGSTSHHYENRKHSNPFVKVRVDYTFFVNDEVKNGTVILPETSVDYLQINDDICVIYLEEEPSENMIFPLPGNDFFILFQVRQ